MDIVDIIIIVGAIAISAVSSIAKSKKKKQEEARQQQSAAPATESDPWEEIRKYLDNPFEKDSKAEEEDEESPFYIPKDASQPMETKPAYHPHSHGAQDRKVEQVFDTRRGHVDKKNTQPPAMLVDLSEEELKPELLINEEIEMGVGIMEDFDLRKAVLYSEILKPKFDS